MDNYIGFDIDYKKTIAPVISENATGLAYSDDFLYTVSLIVLDNAIVSYVRHIKKLSEGNVNYFGSEAM